jgi:hypothetical protein
MVTQTSLQAQHTTVRRSDGKSPVLQNLEDLITDIGYNHAKKTALSAATLPDCAAISTAT